MVQTQDSYIRNLKRIFICVLSAIIFFVGTHFLGIFLINTQIKKFNTALTGVLRNEEVLLNISHASRRLVEYENLGIISCAKLISSDIDNNHILYDSTFKGECQSDYILIDRIPSRIVITSISGLHFSIEYLYLTDYLFKVGFLSARLLLLLFFNYLIFQYWSKIDRMNKRISSEAERSTFLKNMASQLAHDAASPLSLLNILSQIPDIDQKNKNLIESATNRLAHIIKDMRSRSGLDPSEFGSFSPNNSIKSIVSEKQMVQPLNITSNLLSQGIAIGNENEFSRIISNVLNNSIEASKKIPEIQISSSEDSTYVVIYIVDSGIGIPSDLIRKIGTRGFSLRKNGNGLGVYHAKTTLESWGGNFSIASTENVGTTVTIKLKKCLI